MARTPSYGGPVAATRRRCWRLQDAEIVGDLCEFDLAHGGLVLLVQDEDVSGSPLGRRRLARARVSHPWRYVVLLHDHSACGMLAGPPTTKQGARRGTTDHIEGTSRMPDTLYFRQLAGYFSKRQFQERTWWCWNATTVSVARHYDGASNWTQCQLATDVINSDWGEQRRQPGAVYQCCPSNDAATVNCNLGWWPDQGPLQTVDHLHQRVSSPLSKAQIVDEIAANRPITVDIQWRGGGGHIVNIWGYSYLEDGTLVDLWVHDPWDAANENTKIVPYETFRAAYPGNGWWNVSFTTQP